MHRFHVAEPVQPADTSRVSPTIGAAVRNAALDNYRGLVMLLMMAETLHLSRVARAFPSIRFWSFLAYHQTHVEWAGCSLHDTIQPGFSFLVGAALPYSIAARIAKGATFRQMFLHALWRSFLLITLGIFLRSLHRPQTYFTFEDTLTQIGLGYPFLFLIGFLRPRWQWISLAAILAGYWFAWALYPAGPVLDHYTGFAAHWNKTDNLGVAFDRWFLNLFPRVQPFTANSGGYATLSFIPTLGTMILGLAAGRWIKAASPRIPFRRLITAGLIGIASGLLLHVLGICPIVKRIWTPSWTLYSGGICFLFVAGFSWLAGVTDHKRRWSVLLTVVGVNSIAAYLMAHLLEDFIRESFRTHIGPRPFEALGAGLEPLLTGLAVLLIYWLLLFWMYRRKLFLRI